MEGYAGTSRVKRVPHFPGSLVPGDVALGGSIMPPPRHGLFEVHLLTENSLSFCHVPAMFSALGI